MYSPEYQQEPLLLTSSSEKARCPFQRKLFIIFSCILLAVFGAGKFAHLALNMRSSSESKIGTLQSSGPLPAPQLSYPAPVVPPMPARGPSLASLREASGEGSPPPSYQQVMARDSVFARGLDPSRQSSQTAQNRLLPNEPRIDRTKVRKKPPPGLPPQPPVAIVDGAPVTQSERDLPTVRGFDSLYPQQFDTLPRAPSRPEFQQPRPLMMDGSEHTVPDSIQNDFFNSDSIYPNPLA